MSLKWLQSQANSVNELEAEILLHLYINQRATFLPSTKKLALFYFFEHKALSDYILFSMSDGVKIIFFLLNSTTRK